MDETDKENNIKETVDKFLSESDSSFKLCNYLFVLHQRIKILQDEIENCKILLIFSKETKVYISY